jgi:uncharacterized protein with PIN domain
MLAICIVTAALLFVPGAWIAALGLGAAIATYRFWLVLAFLFSAVLFVIDQVADALESRRKRREEQSRREADRLEQQEKAESERRAREEQREAERHAAELIRANEHDAKLNLLRNLAGDERALLSGLLDRDVRVIELDFGSLNFGVAKALCARGVMSIPGNVHVGCAHCYITDWAREMLREHPEFLQSSKTINSPGA